MKKQKGFAVIELFLALILLGAVGGIGVYAWHHSHKSVTKGTHATDKAPYTHPGVWVVYRSAHSTLHFTYPSDWQLVHNAVPNGGPTLEDISLKGPNGFVMTFALAEKSATSPGLDQCVPTYYGPVVKLNSTYSIASTLSVADRSQIATIALIPVDSGVREGALSCAPDASGNTAASDMRFTFEGSYVETSHGYGIIPKAAQTYFDLPEVQTAKTIFESIGQ